MNCVVPSTTPVCYPYAGEVYIAESPSLKRKGLLKFGHTYGDALSRAKSHGGQLTTERSRVVFRLRSNDSKKAEDLLKAHLRQMDALPHGRKELARIELARLTELWKDVVARAAVRTAPVCAVSPSEQTVRTASKAWAAALLMPVRIDSGTKQLGRWMAQSLKDSRIAAALSKKGLVCTYCDMHAPEFRLDYVSEAMQVWLQSHGHSANDLMRESASVEFTVS